MNPRANASSLTTFMLIAGFVALMALPIPAEAPVEMLGREAALAKLAGLVAAFAEFCAIAIITLGIGRAIYKGIRHFKLPGIVVKVRRGLGRALTLALEFTIASDILRTAIAPSRQMLANLAAIVLLRTLLTHFLSEELRDENKEPAKESAP